MTELFVRSRSGIAGVDGPDDSDLTQIQWDPGASALIICDMWDDHHCSSAASRVVEMAPRMNEVVSELRERDTLIVHAPSSCVGFYEGTPARARASNAPHAETPVEFDWNDWNAEREDPLPPSLADPGPCSCDSPEPCCEPGPPYPWTRQISSIGVDARDAVSDDGQEIFNLIESRGIENVIIMGVHTNICVLGRPFGIRQLVYLGKRPLLCRDLTDSFHRGDLGHARGTEMVVEHIERFWCPSVTSEQLVGGPVFSFGKGD